MKDYSAEHERPIAPIFNFEDVDVEAEGLEYVNSSRCNCGGGKMVAPPLFNHPDETNSDEELDEILERRLNISVPEDETRAKERDTPPRTFSGRSRAEIVHSEALRKMISRSLPSRFPSSPESDILRMSYSENEAYRDELRRRRRNKMAMIKRMQHKYHENHHPRTGRLVQCSCTSCWAENILSISAGSVFPSFPVSYVPSRTADKCEKLRSKSRIGFSKRQRTLTYDVWSGKVYEYEVERADLSCVKKNVGMMLTWGSCGEDNREEDYSSDEDEDTDDSEQETCSVSDGEESDEDESDKDEPEEE